MKEKEKAEIKRLSDLLDALNHKDTVVIQQGNTDLIAQHLKEKEKLKTEIERLKNVRVEKLSAEAQKLSQLPFSREITKKEQADMGTLKKSARGPDRGASNDRSWPRDGPESGYRLRQKSVSDYPLTPTLSHRERELSRVRS
ncbi:Protein of uncharacterised function (DUF2810) [Serratia fonticola]|uniref:Protein of uncharacterized function (DUF2810) n=1 Tax=Serratia fonticola TaxID=47917 RepID=A0A4U9WGX2_SERFO|nr:Protein of uncharacterised function (DUF2810) [Serratia fonticola]